LPNLHLQLNPDLTGCFITPRWNRHKRVEKNSTGGPEFNWKTHNPNCPLQKGKGHRRNH